MPFAVNHTSISCKFYFLYCKFSKHSVSCLNQAVQSLKDERDAAVRQTQLLQQELVSALSDSAWFI